MKKKIIITSIILILLASIIVIKIKTENKEEIKNVNSIDTNVDLDNGEEKVNWDSLEEETLTLENKSVTIEKGGVYTLTGEITNGSVIVRAQDENVKIILNNVNITNETGPAIIIESAANTIIEIKEGTTNNLIDGTSYSNTEYDGCIFSKDDLVIDGTGTLNITSNYLDGIVSNDDLKIINGNINITSNDDAIRGKDSVYILNGTFNLNSAGDGIKSTNTTDETKGYINIENGTFNITANNDGIDAETKLIIYNGAFNITTGGGSSAANSAINYSFYGGTSYDTESAKGLKSNDNLVIKNGTFNLDTKDDSVHSNKYVGIEKGTLNITSGDDGIHADEEIIIDNGDIKITKSYEGIEANDITINNGNISVTSHDDGLNISGGNDSSSMGNRPGENNMASSSGKLTINNGTIYINATGDGIDANGSVVINNGTIYVDGPTNSGNGSLDYDVSFEINAGTFIAVGSSGMAQGLSSSSTQYSLMFNLSNNYNAKEIILEDENGNTIIKYTPAKSYSNIIISTSKITKNETYKLKIDGTTITSLTATSTTSSNSPSNYGGPPSPR